MGRPRPTDSRAQADTGFIKVSTSQHPVPSSGVIAEYRYNLFGERISKLTHGDDGTQLTYFVWDGTEVAAETDQDGKVLGDYVCLDGRPVALLAGRTIDKTVYWHRDRTLTPLQTILKAYENMPDVVRPDFVTTD
jgi:hypothetical protein